MTFNEVLAQLEKLIVALPDGRETIDATIVALVASAATMLCATAGKSFHVHAVHEIANAGLVAMGAAVDAIGNRDVRLN